LREDLVVVLLAGPGQLQDRVELPAGDVGDDRLALLPLEHPAVELARRQELAVLPGAAQVAHRLLGAGRAGEQGQGDERPQFRLHDCLGVERLTWGAPPAHACAGAWGLLFSGPAPSSREKRRRRRLGAPLSGSPRARQIPEGHPAAHESAKSGWRAAAASYNTD